MIFWAHQKANILIYSNYIAIFIDIIKYAFKISLFSVKKAKSTILVLQGKKNCHEIGTYCGSHTYVFKFEKYQLFLAYLCNYIEICIIKRSTPGQHGQHTQGECINTQQQQHTQCE